MKRLLLCAALLMLAPEARAGGAAAVAPEYASGRDIPMIDITDDSGTTRSLATFKGSPVILAPFFTRCPLACPMITQGLIRAESKSSAKLGTYRVLMLSFDPRDNAESLRKFRERQHVPLAWTVATAKPADVRKLLDSLGYSYGEAGGLYTHPNLVIAFTPELKTAKYMMGTQYDLDEALAIAQGSKDWIGRYGAIALAILLFVCISSAVYLLTLIRR